MEFVITSTPELSLLSSRLHFPDCSEARLIVNYLGSIGCIVACVSSRNGETYVSVDGRQGHTLLDGMPGWMGEMLFTFEGAVYTQYDFRNMPFAGIRLLSPGEARCCAAGSGDQK